MKTRGEIRCSGRVSILFFACSICHYVPYVVLGVKRTHDKNVISYNIRQGVSNDGNEQ